MSMLTILWRDGVAALRARGRVVEGAALAATGTVLCVLNGPRGAPRGANHLRTARGGESDAVEGLDAGADDYITKSFRLEELLARVEADARLCVAMSEPKKFTNVEARQIGEAIGIDWDSAPFDVEQFRMGMDVELEHGRHDPATDVTGDNAIVTGKIALAHLNEFSDYYTRLERMEAEAEREADQG
jgi:hypothetical protein